MYTIFEQHLFNFQDPNSDRNVFVETVIQDYLSHMRRLGLSIPVEWEHQIFEELFFQVNSMSNDRRVHRQSTGGSQAKSPRELQSPEQSEAQEGQKSRDQRSGLKGLL